MDQQPAPGGGVLGAQDAHHDTNGHPAGETVEGLALARRLPAQWLREALGLEDLPGGGVSIPYWDESGGEMLFRRSRGVPGGPRFRQPAGVGLQPYGLWRLADVGDSEALYITEGESDCWTLWHNGIPALGVAGNNNCACLKAGHLEGFKALYLCADNDEAGRRMPAQFVQRLGQIGFGGRAYLVPLPPGVKDVSELYLRDQFGFASRFRQQVERATLLAVPRPEAAQAPAPPAQPAFAGPIPIDLLRGCDPSRAWLWKGFLARGEVTLLSALWKSGKTTLIAHLMKALMAGGLFLDYALEAARVLYISEEAQERWADRRDRLAMHGAPFDFYVRPFGMKPTSSRWEEFIGFACGLVAGRPYDLIVMDTISNLWPVKDENDACAVQAALMPLHALVEGGASLLLVHHTRKSDGPQATASRGSGALTGFVDTILEFRRYAPSERKCKRRVLTGYSRHDETPDELIIELTDEGYVSCGAREDTIVTDLVAIIAGILPPAEPGLTAEQILEQWPKDILPNRKRFFDVLKEGTEDGSWQRSGLGKKGNPCLYWLPPTLGPWTPEDGAAEF